MQRRQQNYGGLLFLRLTDSITCFPGGGSMATAEQKPTATFVFIQGPITTLGAQFSTSLNLIEAKLQFKVEPVLCTT
jgi:hypothetical protein